MKRTGTIPAAWICAGMAIFACIGFYLGNVFSFGPVGIFAFTILGRMGGFLFGLILDSTLEMFLDRFVGQRKIWRFIVSLENV